MQRIGDDEAGFWVAFDPLTRTMRVNAWGFWPLGVASSFGKTVVDAGRQAGTVQRFVFDMTQLKPMREEGQLAWSMLVAELPRLGATETTVATASHLTKMQLLRLAKQYSARLPIQWIDGPMAQSPSAENPNGKHS
jgi:hypothetical protein